MQIYVKKLKIHQPCTSNEFIMVGEFPIFFLTLLQMLLNHLNYGRANIAFWMLFYFHIRIFLTIEYLLIYLIYFLVLHFVHLLVCVNTCLLVCLFN